MIIFDSQQQAVIQLAQHDLDPDGGWPLEILDARYVSLLMP